MKAYPEYTDSLIEGIDKIPSNWNVMRFRHLFSIGRGLGITKENLQDDGIPCVNYGEIHSKYGFELDLEKHPLKCVHEGYLDTSPSSLLNKGDLVYADTSEDLEGSGNFTQLISDGKTFAGYHTVIARQTRNHDDRFLAYALDSDYCRNQIRRMVKGVKVFSITQAILKDTSILLPSYEEQRAISSFLDANTSRIDNLIAEKENFIKLLSEKRQALISHVVTKGLNPNVSMKDSGVEWIGEIPEHWTECTLRRHVVEHRQGYYTTEDYVDEGVKLLRITDLEKYGEIDAHRAPRVALKDELKNYYLETGDFVFARTGGAGTFGLVGDLEEPMVYASYLIRFRFNKNICPQFLKFAFQSKPLFTEITKNMHGGVNQNIHAENIKDAVMPFPEYDEQERIANYLEVETDRMLVLEEEVLKSIELLKEHRTALISAAVTGKIDVREEV